MPEIHSITQIRAWYPTPMTESDAKSITDRKCYCVAGAIALAHEDQLPNPASPFPDYGELEDLLHYLNPRLLSRHAIDLAACIIDSNDAGDFETAWQWAAYALTYTPAAF